jgi:SAM-dependent methyltransferase
MSKAASVYHAPACMLCDRQAWLLLPNPGQRSIASDLRIVDETLDKLACASCGFVRRAAKNNESSAFFEEGYTLYAHDPGRPIERLRQSNYARWIAEVLSYTPRRVLDVGCGNGSLLASLRERWPRAEFLGCDPSADAVRHVPSGVHLWQGTAESLPAGIDADLVVSVNVVEHTQDPIGFIRRLRHAAGRDGSIVLICPDGGRPGVELLFADHLWSFTSWNLDEAVRRAGMGVRAVPEVAAAVGDFQMAIAGSDGGAAAPMPHLQRLNARRTEFLETWQALDRRLVTRLPGEVVCFGTGEAAALLRAYAPTCWERVTAFTADYIDQPGWTDRSAVPLDSIDAATPILVGVRPADQERVASRLRDRFAHVVTWYDLVAEQEH